MHAHPDLLAPALAALALAGAERRAARAEAARAAYLGSLHIPPQPGELDMGAVIRHLREALPDDAILANGAGNFAIWSNKHLPITGRQRLLAPQAGAMGYGVPAAIAAKIAHPERTVVAFAGDGDFQMTGMELGAAAQARAWPIVLIVNNRSYGTIRMHQERTYPGRVSFTDLENPDFVALARAFGTHAERVTRTADFPAAFARARASPNRCGARAGHRHRIAHPAPDAQRDARGRAPDRFHMSRPPHEAHPMPDYHRILITGAAGSLGGHLRRGLTHLADRIRLVDVAPMGDPAPHEEIVVANLADRAAAFEATRGCDAILHFAGHPREQSFEEILAETIPAAYHVYEGARRNGTRRVVYASSIHAVGFHAVEDVPDTRVPHRPDTFYGLTKTFTEDLASLYWDKFGLETVALRICSCFPEPSDRRMLWSWLSFADCVRLAEAALTAPRVGFSVIYGTSDNAARAVSNVHATHIGFRPRDSADGYAAAVHRPHRAPGPGEPGRPGRRRRLRGGRPPGRWAVAPTC